MKPSLLFLHILLSPIFVAGFTIKILVPDIWKETTIVWGKNTSEGVPMEQSRAKNDGESGSICPNGSPCKTKYAGITDITFAKPTVDPRPINITMGSELLQCYITSPPSIDDNGVWWFIDWGYSAMSEFNDGRITCTRGPAN